MNRVFLKHNIIMCNMSDRQSGKSDKSFKLVHKRRLMKLKTDINLKLKDKKLQASEYCDELFYNDYDYYCINLLDTIEALEQKQLQIDLILKHLKD